jgi:hypothetical protein
VKFNAFGSRKAKKWENGQFFGWDANLGYFCGANFSRSMTPNEDMLDILRNHNDGDHIVVPNSIDMFSTSTLVTRVNA